MVDIQSGGASSLPWYDRGAVDKSIGVRVSVGASSGEIELSYTVPADKKAFVSSMHVFFLNNNGITNNVESHVSVEITPSGGARAILLRIASRSSVSYVSEGASVAAKLLLSAGDKISIFYENSHTAGFITAIGGIGITEFTP